MRDWEKRYGGITVDLEYLSFTAAFVESMAGAVKVSIEDLIRRVKEDTN